jgi:hypothetical protein
MERWKNRIFGMRSTIYSIILLSCFCLAVTATQAATIFMWTDVNGRMHITDEPLVVISGFTGCADEDGSEQNPGPGRQAVPVETVTVKQRDLEDVIDSIGTLEPLPEVEIRPEKSHRRLTALVLPVENALDS